MMHCLPLMLIFGDCRMGFEGELNIVSSSYEDILRLSAASSHLHIDDDSS